jgi:hypothetical protein
MLRLPCPFSILPRLSPLRLPANSTELTLSKPVHRFESEVSYVRDSAIPPVSNYAAEARSKLVWAAIISRKRFENPNQLIHDTEKALLFARSRSTNAIHGVECEAMGSASNDLASINPERVSVASA